MSRDFVGALLQLNAEKQVSREQLIRTVEEAIAAAYRRVANEEDIHVQIERRPASIRVYRARIATTDPIDEEQQLTHFSLDDARKHKADARPGELVEIEELDGDAFGRIGAQTAKQVVLQRLREAERDAVFDQFADREGELVTGTVNRVEPRAMILDMGKGVEGILATTEQSPLEHYRIGQNVKAYVLEVRRTPRGPALFVSRTHKGFLKRLFELEVPEIHNGTVEIRAIAREAGSRSKVAVASRQEGLDPVGATVGQRGARVQAVVAELGGEKIDVIPWNDDPAAFVANALSPAQVLSVDIDQEHRIANVTVPERMLSLAIGREGQNARLAARLTGWRIDIRSDVSVAEAKAAADDAKAAGRGRAGGRKTRPRGRCRRDRGRRGRRRLSRRRHRRPPRRRRRARKAVTAEPAAEPDESPPTPADVDRRHVRGVLRRPTRTRSRARWWPSEPPRATARRLPSHAPGAPRPPSGEVAS